jgi:hypothetical protein
MVQILKILDYFKKFLIKTFCERLVGFVTYNDYLIVELLVIFFLTAVILFANV